MPSSSWPTDSDYRDATDLYRGDGGPWGTRGLYWGRCDLREAISGRICFRIGTALECGGDYAFSQGESHTVTLSGGASASGAGVGVELAGSFSHQWTVGVTVTRKIGDCQSANPEVCFPDSTLKVFDCTYETLLTYSEGVEIEFEPGGTKSVVWNIVDDPDCCPDAPRQQSAHASPRMTTVGREAGTIVMVPGAFHLRDPLAVPEPATVEKMLGHQAERLEAASLGRGCTRNLGIVDSRGEAAWIAGPEADPAGAVAFVSAGRRAYAAESVTLLGEQETIPVIVAGSAQLGDAASVRVERVRPHAGSQTVAKTQMTGAGDGVRVLGAFVPHVEHELEYGDRGRIVVDVWTEGRLRSFCQPFAVVRTAHG